jgi:large subunit ribosomal protein L22
MEAVARLKNCPYSPQKMRLLADIIRGKKVNDALSIIKHHPKKTYAIMLEKLLMSAVSNWQVKNEEVKVDEDKLFVKTIMVDNARQVKRIRPAPQGRAYRIRKRSNHVFLVVDDMTDNNVVYEVENENTIQE